MRRSRRKEIEQHLPEERIEELLRKTEDDARLRRIGFVENLDQGDTIPETADREGRAPATGFHDVFVSDARVADVVAIDPRLSLVVSSVGVATTLCEYVDPSTDE